MHKIHIADHGLIYYAIATVESIPYWTEIFGATSTSIGVLAHLYNSDAGITQSILLDVKENHSFSGTE